MLERRTRYAAVLLLVLAALTAGCQVTLFAGDYYQPDPGQIIFGSDLDPSSSMVLNPTSSMALEGDMAFVGFFPRHVTGTVYMEVTRDGGPPEVAGNGYTFSSPGNFYAGKWHLSDFPGLGRYLFRIVLEDEVLAEGTLDLTAPD